MLVVEWIVKAETFNIDVDMNGWRMKLLKTHRYALIMVFTVVATRGYCFNKLCLARDIVEPNLGIYCTPLNEWLST